MDLAEGDGDAQHYYGDDCALTWEVWGWVLFVVYCCLEALLMEEGEACISVMGSGRGVL